MEAEETQTIQYVLGLFMQNWIEYKQYNKFKYIFGA